MPCIEAFVRNVRAIIRDRKVSVRELSRGTGISESYLSSILNGNRVNVSDSLKDRISTYMRIPVWQLFVDQQDILEPETPVLPDGLTSLRRELHGLVGTFIERMNLEDYRGILLEVIGMLDDRQALAVSYYLSQVLVRVDRHGIPIKLVDIASLTKEELGVLACFCVAGDGARLEWVRAISQVSAPRFAMATEKLESINALELVEDSATTKVRLNESARLPLASMFTQLRLREMYFCLAMAMHNYREDGYSFDAQLSEVLLKAGRVSESAERLEKAASAAGDEAFWSEAVQYWYRAALLHGMLAQYSRKGACLISAAICSCRIHGLEDAEEIAASALSVGEEARVKPTELAMMALRFAGEVESRSLARARSWYEKALRIVHCGDSARGAILANLATCDLRLGNAAMAEATLKELDHWLSRQNTDSVYVRHISCHRKLLSGLLMCDSRQSDDAQRVFEEVLAENDIHEIDSAIALHNLGIVFLEQDRVEEALQCFREARETFENSGLSAFAATTNVALARTMLRKGEFAEASDLLTAVFDTLGEEPSRVKGWAYLIRAFVRKVSGRARLAASDARRALDMFSKVNAMRDLACAALTLSKMESDVGDKSSSAYYETLAFKTYEKNGWDAKDLHADFAGWTPLAKT